MFSDEVLLIERRLLDTSLVERKLHGFFSSGGKPFKHVLTRMSDVCTKLANLDIPCVSDSAKPYFRDVLDHLARIDAMSDV